MGKHLACNQKMGFRLPPTPLAPKVIWDDTASVVRKAGFDSLTGLNEKGSNMGKIADFLNCLWSFLNEPPKSEPPLTSRPLDVVIVDGWDLRGCPNCQSRDLAINKGFTYVWCRSCGMNGPCFDGQIADAVMEWNDLPRKGDDPSY